MSSVLDPEGLVRAMTSKPQAQPQMGEKLTHKEAHEEESRTRLQQVWDLLGEERVAHSNSLKEGEWKEQDQKVVVTKQRGSVQGGTMDPEEALFALQSGQMILRANGLPMSIQRARTVMIRGGEDRYAVYSHLTKLGYRVKRHLVKVFEEIEPTGKWKERKMKINEERKRRREEPTVLSSDEEDVKVVVKEEEIGESLTKGPLRDLWTGETKPLLKPRHAIDTKTILEKIAVDVKKAGAPCDRELSVDFDVYAPMVSAKQALPDVPNYRVVVTNVSEPVPKLVQVRAIENRTRDNVPVLFAVVGPSSIGFHCFSKVKLPKDITMG